MQLFSRRVGLPSYRCINEPKANASNISRTCVPETEATRMQSEINMTTTATRAEAFDEWQTNAGSDVSAMSETSATNNEEEYGVNKVRCIS